MAFSTQYARAAAALVAAALAPLSLQATTIQEARQQGLNQTVTVRGRVTVAAEFGGPAYIQDGTGGIAVFFSDMFNAVRRGDSVEVTGPTTEFQATSGTPGSGLFQISGTGITWQVVDTVAVHPEPLVLLTGQVNESRESMLVRIDDGIFLGGTAGQQRVFQANTNYSFSTANGTVQVRIDNDTELVGAAIPEGKTSVVGVLSQFRGTYQLLPRDVADVGVEATEDPWAGTPRTATLDLTTWNVEWFGDPSEMPANDSLQRANVRRVLDSVEADIIALQEVVNVEMLREVVAEMGGFDMVVSSYQQPQKLAILWRTATVDTVAAREVVLASLSGNFAAGRWPLRLDVRYTNAQGAAVRYSVVNIHAKAGGQAGEDYDWRANDSKELKRYLENSDIRDAQGAIVMGDFNDNLLKSTYQDIASPYANFVSDSANWYFATLPLAKKGLASIGGLNAPIIDHIMVSSSVRPLILEGSEKVENPRYIGSYLSTTSDHFPVSVRLAGGFPTSADPREATPGAPAESVLLRGNPVEGGLLRALLPSWARSISVVDIRGVEHYTMQVPPSAELLLDVAAMAPQLYFLRVAGGRHVQVVPFSIGK